MTDDTDRTESRDSDARRHPWDMLIEMGADLNHNPHSGGFWCCSWNDGRGIHLSAYSSDTPEEAIRNLHEEWVEAGSPEWLPLSSDGEEKRTAWCNQRNRWLERGRQGETELPHD